MAVRKIADSVSSRTFAIVAKSKRKKFSAFTLAELVVVVTVLTILASVGFVALSGYLSDARESASKANVRSVYTAISAESAVASVSPRYFVVHDPAYALTGSAYVVFGTNSAMLVPGDWSAPGTNYSAGNPDWVKLKMNPEKFKISSFPWGFQVAAFAAADPSKILVWAADVMELWAKSRARSFIQTAGLFSGNSAFVVGNYPVALSGSVSGLVKDLANSSSTGALVDGAKTGSVPGCLAQTVSGYPVPALASGQSAAVSKTVANGTVSGGASCSFGAVAIGSESASCDSGYVPSGLSCVADVCWLTVPSNATSNATSQSVSGNWHYSATAWQCTFACNPNYSWDGSSCRASCLVPAADSYSGQTYAVSPNGALLHGASSSASASAAFGTSPSNGSLSATFAYSCSDGILSRTVASWTGVCQSNYTWNVSWSSPSCAANSQTFTCAAKPATWTVWNTVSNYSQTWNGSAWTPASSTTVYNASASSTSCNYACASGYGWDGSVCQSNCAASTQTVNAHSYSVSALNHGATVSPTSVVAVSNGSRTYQQTFSCSNGTVATSGSETNPSNSCNSGYAWNGSSCVANSWSSWSWGACSGETGTWGYSAWGTCSVTCWGGTQTRTASCTRNGNGTQSRTVQCLRYDGAVLADANCLTAKPATSQSCTQGTDAVCGTVGATSQACNTQACPVNWACSTTAGACTAGTATWDNGATACGTTRTWSCAGLNGGTNASCSKANAACATGHWTVYGCIPSSSCSPVCNATQESGWTCTVGVDTSSCCIPWSAYCGWPGSSYVVRCQ